MRPDPPPREEALQRLLALGLTALVFGTLLRLWLLWDTRDLTADLSFGQALSLLQTGVRLDGVVAGYMVLCGTGLLFLPSRVRARTASLYTFCTAFLIGAWLPVEIFFFRYYGFRPNYLLLDHLGDVEVWHAVAGSYLHTPMIGAVVGSVLASLLLHRALSRGALRLAPARWLTGRGAHALASVFLAASAALAARGTLDHRPINPSAAAVTANRVANEVAGSGLHNLAYEVVRRSRGEALRLGDVQELLPREEAHARIERLRSDRDTASKIRIENVVVVVMESFTAKLVGALDGRPALSPEFDELAREGLLLASCYATGERTVQGLEAILASFPPLPGVSVIRRPEAQVDFPTLASALSERGYDTLFFYGGQGIFDNMRSFFLGNGFREFIEERDFADPEFRGSWGVSDEDLFRRANQELQARFERGRPFLAAVLTVSLHSPWEFPKEGAPSLPPDTPVPPGFERDELANFLYADFAVGRFIREARRLPYFDHTLFVLVADHGVHLRGRALVPSEEYRVPALFLAPGKIAPGRIDAVTSQLDIAPTVLGLLGMDHVDPFFGRNLLARAEGSGLAVVVYNKTRYGARRADRLTVLSGQDRLEAYRVTSGREIVSTDLSLGHREDSRDALALIQVAEESLESRRSAPPIPRLPPRAQEASLPEARTFPPDRITIAGRPPSPGKGLGGTRLKIMLHPLEAFRWAGE